MATTNTQQAPSATGTAIQPAFKRVSQGEDRHADIYAVIATLVGNDKTVDDIRKQAETFGVPKTGPYFAYLDGDLIAKLLAAYGLVGTVWKEASAFKDLSEVAITMVDYDADWEVGRCVLVHRQKGGDGKTIQYAIDPYMHADNKLHIRTDLKGLEPSWYIGVTAMNKPSGK